MAKESEERLDAVWCIDSETGEKVLIDRLTNKRILSEDPLKQWVWPFLRVNSGGAKEFKCPCGVGHGGMHGCCGCCQHPSFKEKTKGRD